MLFLAECIRIFTTWQAIPFKRKFYFDLWFQGFLVEHKLNLLLAPLEKDERSLMKLDAIFSVSTHYMLHLALRTILVYCSYKENEVC